MTPDLKAKLARVLTEFGIWEAGRRCNECRHPLHLSMLEWEWRGDHLQRQKHIPHEISLPELTPELAWKALMEARRRMLEVDMERFRGLLLTWFYTSEADDPEALITAIAAALEK